MLKTGPQVAVGRHAAADHHPTYRLLIRRLQGLPDEDIYDRLLKTGDDIGNLCGGERPPLFLHQVKQ